MIILACNTDKESVELILDDEGIASLLNTLQGLRKSGGHSHLMTPSWSGDDLSEISPGPEYEIINHFRIDLLTAKQKEKLLAAAESNQ